MQSSFMPPLQPKAATTEQKPVQNALLPTGVATPEKTAGDDGAATDGGLAEAAAQVAQAQASVYAAQRELDQAQELVNTYHTAVDYAQQAVSLAETAAKQAKEAQIAAERSLEYVEVAQKAWNQAKTTLEQEEVAVQATAQVLASATATTEDAARNLQTATSHEQVAQELATQVQQVLLEKITSLQAMNRPELDLTLGSMMGQLAPTPSSPVVIEPKWRVTPADIPLMFLKEIEGNKLVEVAEEELRKLPGYDIVREVGSIIQKETAEQATLLRELTDRARNRGNQPLKEAIEDILPYKYLPPRTRTYLELLDRKEDRLNHMWFGNALQAMTQQTLDQPAVTKYDPLYTQKAQGGIPDIQIFLPDGNRSIWDWTTKRQAGKMRKIGKYLDDDVLFLIEIIQPGLEL